MRIEQAQLSLTGLVADAVSVADANIVAIGGVLLSTGAVPIRVGQFGLVQAWFRARKGGVTGDTQLNLTKGVGGTIRWYPSAPGNEPIVDFPTHVNGTDWWGSLTGMFQVTAAGSPLFRLAGSSQGSDCTIFAGNSSIAVYLFN